MEESGKYRYNYPRPALTVDLVLFCTTENNTSVLLIKRKHAPFAGQWALPGGFVDEGETLYEAAQRELKEETHLTDIPIKQIGAFAAPGRDPRGWTISVAYLGVCTNQSEPLAGDDAAEVAWFPVQTLPVLAFDHLDIINTARYGSHSQES